MQWERSGVAISCSHGPIMEKEHGEPCDGEGFLWKREGKGLTALGRQRTNDSEESLLLSCCFQEYGNLETEGKIGRKFTMHKQ